VGGANAVKERKRLLKQKIIELLQPVSGICIIAGVTLTIFTRDNAAPLIFLITGLLTMLACIYFNDEDTFYFAKIKPNAKIPCKDEENGCFDLYACIDESIIIPPHTNKLIPTGIASAFNSKYRIAFRERGTNTKSNSIILAGQIDSGFRNEYFISVYNGNDIPMELTNTINEIEKTEEFIRVPTCKATCQFAVEYVPKVKFVETTYERIKKIKSERGLGQLGSSGK
jgi:dUTP pyrophosphatase